MQQLHAASECAAALERMLSHVERDAAAEERGALLARLRQAEARAMAAEAEGSAVRAAAAEAETVRARALEEREEAVQRWREMQGELEQAHKLRAASVTAATAADIRARAAEFDVAAAERKASEAIATAESAVTGDAAVGAAEVESEAVVVAEGAAAGARPRKLTRRGGRTASSDSAGTAAAETAPPPVDERDYQVPTASQRAPGIEVNSVFVSKVRHCCPCGRACCRFLRASLTNPPQPVRSKPSHPAAAHAGGPLSGAQLDICEAVVARQRPQQARAQRPRRQRGASRRHAAEARDAGLEAASGRSGLTLPLLEMGQTEPSESPLPRRGPLPIHCRWGAQDTYIRVCVPWVKVSRCHLGF